LAWFWRPERPRRGPSGWGWLALQSFYLALRGAYLDRLPFQASAITFMSLLSLVPALAISFSLAKGLGYADQLEKFLLNSEFTASQAEIFQQIIGYVQRTQVGTLGVIGVVVLVATLVVTLSSVEETFNRVWEVRVQRGWVRRFTDYLSVLVVVPLVVLATTTIWAAVSSLELVQWFRGLALIGPVATWGMGLGPLLMLTAAFMFIYLFLPNTSIPFWSAALGGAVAAAMWWGAQSLYLYFQIGVARYNAIYGGFALLPLFFIWLQVSWMVLLFGNELAHAHHICRRGRLPRAVLPRLREAQREVLGLRLMHLVAWRFHQGGRPATLTELATELGAPFKEVRRLALDLGEAEILSRPDPGERVQPARSLASLKVEDVLAALRGEAAAPAEPDLAGADEAVAGLLRRARAARREAVGELTLLDLVAPGHCELAGKK
jgi:membrane protein